MPERNVRISQLQEKDITKFHIENIPELIKICQHKNAHNSNCCFYSSMCWRNNTRLIEIPEGIIGFLHRSYFLTFFCYFLFPL